MKQKKLLFLALFALGLVISCSKDDSPSTPVAKAPTISGLTPSSGPVGTVFVISGTNFSTTPSKNTVKIGTTTATVSAATATKITTSVPQGATTGKVSVTVGGKIVTSTGNFTVTQEQANNAPPVIEAQSFEAAEDIADTAVIGTVAATDPEQDALTFSISVNDDDIFEIGSSSGELSLAEGKALDFETAESHAITVAVSDGNGSATATITINVADVYESLAEDPASFVTTWVTTVNNETIKIGVDPDYDDYDYTIDWGDGTVEDITDSNDPQHEYAEVGTYTVAIIGTFPAIRMNNGNLVNADRDKLASIEQWGTNPWASMNNAFASCGNMVYNATDEPDLSQVTNMSGLFIGVSTFNGDISGWDVSKVTDMSFMFDDASAFNGDLSDWDVSNVTNMSNMFADADAFEGTGLSSWNVSNVTNMSGMFNYAVSFNADLSGWDVSNVTSMREMFYQADVFNSNLEAWKIGNVIDMTGMLDGSGLSSTNYAATLVGWHDYVEANGAPVDIITLGASGLLYCNSASNKRSVLAVVYGWYIDDVGPDQTCP
ncbi:MAG: BspA family leucine-rich repeat surface protein [Allomuricauda sp.]